MLAKGWQCRPLALSGSTLKHHGISASALEEIVNHSVALFLDWRAGRRRFAALIKAFAFSTSLIGSSTPSRADRDGTFIADQYAFMREDKARLQDSRAQRALEMGARSIQSFSRARDLAEAQGGAGTQAKELLPPHQRGPMAFTSAQLPEGNRTNH